MFDFSSAAFAPGSAVTFALEQVSGPSTVVFYEVPSLGNEACPILQTNGTEAPLSTFRRNGVEVRVFAGEVHGVRGNRRFWLVDRTDGK